MNIRIASTYEDMLSASVIHAKGWQSAYKDMVSADIISQITTDYWLSFFKQNSPSQSLGLAILSYQREDVGAATFSYSRDYAPLWGEIPTFFVLPDQWEKGLTDPLMDFLLEQLWDMGCHPVHLWSTGQNEKALDFYHKYGFKPDGRTKEFAFQKEKVPLQEWIYPFPSGSGRA